MNICISVNTNAFSGVTSGRYRDRTARCRTKLCTLSTRSQTRRATTMLRYAHPSYCCHPSYRPPAPGGAEQPRAGSPRPAPEPRGGGRRLPPAPRARRGGAAKPVPTPPFLAAAREQTPRTFIIVSASPGCGGRRGSALPRHGRLARPPMGRPRRRFSAPGPLPCANFGLLARRREPSPPPAPARPVAGCAEPG